MINLKSMPFESKLVDGEYDREVNSKEFAKYLSSFITNGVIVKGSNVVDNELRVANAGGLNVSIDIGAININGRVGWREKNLDTLQLVAGGQFPRIDRVIAELNTTEDVRSIVLKVLKGEEGENPTPPGLIRTDEIYQLSLAQCKINAGAAIIAEIVDERTDNEVCALANLFVGINDVTGANAETIVVRDAEDNFTAINVEDVLAELFAMLKRISSNSLIEIQDIRLKLAEQKLIEFLNKTGIGFYDLFENINYVDVANTAATVDTTNNEVLFEGSQILKMKKQTFNAYSNLELAIYDKERETIGINKTFTSTNEIQLDFKLGEGLIVGDRFYYNGVAYEITGAVKL